MNPDSLEEEELHSTNTKQWEASNFEGAWVKGATAGGCRNHIGIIQIYFICGWIGCFNFCPFCSDLSFKSAIPDHAWRSRWRWRRWQVHCYYCIDAGKLEIVARKILNRFQILLWINFLKTEKQKSSAKNWTRLSNNWIHHL